MEKIPEIFKKAGYKHISEEELIEIYHNLKDEYGDNGKMYNIIFDFNEETFEFTNIKKEDYGVYLKKKERKEKLDKINENKNKI